MVKSNAAAIVSQLDMFSPKIEVIPRVIRFDKKIITPTERKKSGMVEAFAEIEEHADLVALIIHQASEDSMISPYFSQKSTEAIFESPIPDSYDGFLFMSSDRLDLYANIINLDPENDIRRKWRREYCKWVKNEAPAVAKNIFEHIKKLETTPDLHTTVYKDSISFQKSAQCEYWRSFL